MFSQHLAKPRGPGNCLEVTYPLWGLLGGAVHLPRIMAAVPSLSFATLICCEEALKRSPFESTFFPLPLRALFFPRLQNKNNLFSPNNYWNSYALQNSLKSSHHPYIVFFHQPCLNLLQPSNDQIHIFKSLKLGINLTCNDIFIILKLTIFFVSK